MTYQMIAIDIDDTLIDTSHHIPARVVEAVAKAKAAGAIVVLCTGRTRKGALRFYEQLALDTLFITAGGAEVYDKNGDIAFAFEVEPALVKEVLAFGYERCIHCQVYIDGELVFKEHNEWAAMYEKPYGFPGIVMPGLMEMDEIQTPKVLYVLEEDKVPAVRKEAIRRFPTLTIKQSKPNFLEFAHPDVNKGEALEFVAKHYGVDMQRVIAVGDTEIDIPMIERAGLGVAVANAYETVKEAADAVCPSQDDGGVADVIHQYILEANA